MYSLLSYSRIQPTMVAAESAIVSGVKALVATNTTTASASAYANITGPSPLSTFLDRLSLLSPQTWWGLWDVLVENPFTTWNGQALIHSVIGFLLPLILLGILRIALPSSSSSTILLLSNNGHPHGGRARRLLWTTLLSPWIISSFFHILQQLSSPLQSLSGYYQGRFRVLPEAETILQQCLDEGCATWNRNFVVFWPPPSSNSNADNSDTTTTPIIQPPSRRRGIWILPGALVPHIAYAPIAERLSKAGFVVVIQSLEPTRLAHSKILTASQLQKHWNHPLFCKSSPNNNHSTTSIQWNLLGHSMGSFYCMKLARVLPNVHKIVLWGMASFLHLGTDLSDATTTADILVIQGSDDVLRDMTKQDQEEFQQLFPPTTTQQRTISGGTHDGFASYQVPTTSCSSSSSNTGGITPNEQQALACEWTVQFLSNTTRTHQNDDKDNGNGDS